MLNVHYLSDECQAFWLIWYSANHLDILFVVNVYFFCVNASKELMHEYSLWRGVIDIHPNTLISQVQRYDWFFSMMDV